jgi:hypothetical protein
MRGLVLGCGHARAGVLDRAEERQRDGEKGEGSGCFSPPFPRVSWPGPGRGEGASTAGQSRRGRGTVWRSGTRARAANLVLQVPARKVFVEMLERDSNLNF